MNRILFVGGSGLLGRNWLKVLNNKFDVFVVVNKKKNLIKKKNFFFYKSNINNFNFYHKLIKEKKINVIINLASLTNLEECEKNKKVAVFKNVIIAKKLVKLAIVNNINIVHLSTDHLFNGTKPNKYSEKDRCDPLNYYSLTKLKAEKEVKKYKKSLVIRTNFFGWGFSYRKSFSDYILLNLKKKKYINLWYNIYFTPVYINYLIYIIHLLLNKKIFGTINISSNEKISKYEFGLRLCKLFKLNKKYILRTDSSESFISRPKNMSLSNKKLLKLFPSLEKNLHLNKQIKFMYEKKKFKLQNIF